MDIVGMLTLLLSFILVALVAGNNLSICASPIVSSRIVRKRTGILLTIIGYVAGFVIQGSVIRTAASTLLPSGSVLIPVVLAVAIIVFAIAHLRRVPEPLSIAFACSLFGASLAFGTLDIGFISLTLIFWAIAGIATVGLASISLGAMQKALRRNKIWTGISTARGLLVLLSFLTAFTLGANTIGIVYAILPAGIYTFAAVILALVLGSLFLSAGELVKLGEELLPLRYASALTAQITTVMFVELATLTGLPLSNTQMLTLSMYGERLRYKERLLSKKAAVQVFSVWVVTAVASFAITYIAARAILLL